MEKTDAGTPAGRKLNRFFILLSHFLEKSVPTHLRSGRISAILALMGGIVRYRGRQITKHQVRFLRRLIKENPTASRRALSRQVCEAWEWKQANGQPCDMICRGMMLHLERCGLLKLPEKKAFPKNPLAAGRKKPPVIQVDQSPIQCSLKQLGPLEIRQVRRTGFEKLYNSLIDQHHYLGYCHPVGEQLKYVVFADDRPIACFAFSSAPRHLGPRDRFIGWAAEQRKSNIHLISYNTRFLILPWIQVRYLASHLLARLARQISSDWQKLYQHPIYFLETFIDTQKFKGTCYRAANWIYLGKTTGRGKDDQTNKPNRSIKAIWGYPLRPDFRLKLCSGGAKE